MRPEHSARTILAFLLAVTLLFAGCGGGGESPDASDTTVSEKGTTGSTGTSDEETVTLYGIPVYAQPMTYDQYALEPIDNTDFYLLDEAGQYRLANKLLAALFLGEPAETLQQMIESGTFIDDLKTRLATDNSDEELSSVEAKIKEQAYRNNYGDNIDILARLFYLSEGSAYVNRWAAFVLAQTILFSPAYELDSVNKSDITNVYNHLVSAFDEGYSLQWTTFTHMIGDENWRRFRSPEDNGREMLEIFLMDFDDSHVPLAAQALKNWRLDTDSNTLVITLDTNYEPITGLFSESVVDGFDFYSRLVADDDLLPTIAARLTAIYFPDHTQSQQESIALKLAQSEPESFVDLLKQIVFSKEFLFNSTKVKSYEEAFYPIAKSLDWQAHTYSFYRMYRNLEAMHQSTMRYKLGRKTEVPIDSYSFAKFHKTLRETVFINEETNASNVYDDGWRSETLFGSEPAGATLHDHVASMVHPLFLAAVGRKATDEELAFFIGMVDQEQYDAEENRNFRYWNLTEESYRKYLGTVVLDYLSRLSETYQFSAVAAQ